MPLLATVQDFTDVVDDPELTKPMPDKPLPLPDFFKPRPPSASEVACLNVLSTPEHTAEQFYDIDDRKLPPLSDYSQVRAFISTVIDHLHTFVGKKFYLVATVAEEFIQNAYRYGDQLANAPRDPELQRSDRTREAITVSWNVFEGLEPTLAVQNSGSYLFDPTVGLRKLATDAHAAMKQQGLQAAHRCTAGVGQGRAISVSQRNEFRWEFDSGEVITVSVKAELAGKDEVVGATLTGTRETEPGVIEPLSEDDFRRLIAARSMEPCKLFTVTAYLHDYYWEGGCHADEKPAASVP